jgi:hypothetical protein
MGEVMKAEVKEPAFAAEYGHSGKPNKKFLINF